MSRQIELCVVRIHKAKGGVVGAGFLVDDRHILTCAHVIDDALGRKRNIHSQPETAIQFDFPLITPNTFYIAKVIIWHLLQADGQGDISVLQLADSKPLPATAAPVPLLLADDLVGHSCHAFGYPEHYQKPGRWSSGVLVKKNAFGWMQIENKISQKHFVTQGFSGGPVWDEELNAVVGMVVAADVYLEISTMIPTNLLFDAWPPLKTISFQKLKARWHSWEAQIRARLHSEQPYYPTPTDRLPSPLEDLWHQFLGRSAWHEEVNSELEELNKLVNHSQLQQFPPIKSLAHQISSINLLANYEVILDDLKLVFEEQTENRIAEIVHRDEDKKAGSRQLSGLSDELLSALKEVRYRISKIRKIIESPIFRRCFFIMGSWGAGKTFFVSSLFSLVEQQRENSSHQHKPFMSLILTHHKNDESIAEQLLQSIREATDINWSDLDQFNTFLLESNEGVGQCQLIIAIDDLQDWLAIRPQSVVELVEFIRDYSYLHTFYWVINLRDSYYDTISRLSGDFWERYSGFGSLTHLTTEEREREKGKYGRPFLSSQEYVPRIGGWLLLDRLNQTKRIGLELIRNRIDSTHQNTKLALEVINDDELSLKHISNPFVARVLIDLSEKIPLRNLVTLNFIEFMRRFWEKRVDQLDYNPLSSHAELKQAIFLVAHTIAQLGELEPLLQILLDNITTTAEEKNSTLQKREQANEAINILERANLIKRLEMPAPDLSGWVDERIQLRFDPFWKWRLAKQFQASPAIQAQNVGVFQSEWEAGFAKNAPGYFQEGVFEFLLLLLDSQISNQQVEIVTFVEEIWLIAFASRNLSEVAVWFAGPKASKHIQQHLAQWAQTHMDARKDGRVLFAYMHFINDAALETLDLPTRFQLLQMCYPNISEAKLSSYYLYIAEQLLAAVKDSRTLLSCFHYLSGCEVMAIADTLARIAMDKLVETCQGNVQVVSERFIEYLHRQSSEQQEKKRTFSRTFRQWLIYEFCDYLTSVLGIEGYYFLQKQNWYRARKMQINYPVSFEMVQEANIALGSYYRHVASDHEKKTFAKIVKGLVESRKREHRKRAFFLIRHTKPYLVREYIPVDKVFRAMLKQLYLDPDLSKLSKKHENEILLNFKDEKALKDAREKIHRRYAKSRKKRGN